MALTLREIILSGASPTADTSEIANIDKELLKALSSYYGNAVLEDTVEFELALLEYFKVHYKDLISDNSYNFLTLFSQKGSQDVEEGDLFKIARQFEIDTEVFAENFGIGLVIKDGLIYDRESGFQVIYATDKAISSIIEDLDSSSLYYKHLAEQNTSFATNASYLQNHFIHYAKENKIELETSIPCEHLAKKRWIKKKTNHPSGNIVNFQEQSC